MDSAFAWLCVIFIAATPVCIVAPDDPPQHGFQVIVNGPEFGRQREALYVYALNSQGLDEGDEIEFTKSTGLQSNIVQTGPIRDGELDYGCYLRVGAPSRQRGIRYGTYTASSGDSVLHAFTKPKTALLDTRGVYTVTIFPESEDSSALSANSPDSVGVKWTPGCWIIKWCKGRSGVVHKGARMKLTSIEQAGIYTLQRGSRGARGWSVQIEVIAATCPEDMYWEDGTNACQIRDGPSCENGGVVRESSPDCTCPPGFGSTTNRACDYPDIFIIGAPNNMNPLHCEELEGGNSKCKGYLFCYGDLYGCSCASGWYGNNCDKPCPKGTYGANCSQKCPAEERDCNRFIGYHPDDA